MKEYQVLKNAYAYGISICKARRLTEEEKKCYSDTFGDTGFVCLGDIIKLKNIKQGDLHDVLNRDLSAPDGWFDGYFNASYILTEKEAKRFLSLNSKREVKDT